MKFEPLSDGPPRALPTDLRPSVTRLHRRTSIFLLVLSAVALVTAAIAVPMFLSYRNLNRTAETQGTIHLAYVDSVDRNSRAPDELHVTLSDVADAPSFTITSSWFGSFGRDNQGRTLQVYYSPEAPEFVRLVDRSNYPAGIQILTVFGLLLPIAALLATRSRSTFLQVLDSPEWRLGMLELNEETKSFRVTNPTVSLDVDGARYFLKAPRSMGIKGSVNVWAIKIGGTALVVPVDRRHRARQYPFAPTPSSKRTAK